MKPFFYCIALLVAATSAYSQTTISIGPYIAPKMGINITTQPEFFIDDPINGSRYVEVESQTTYDVDLGLSFKVNLSHLNASLFFDAGYTTTSSSFITSEDTAGSGNYTTTVHYLTISPNYAAKWFFVGLTLGIPVSASTTNKSGSFSADADNMDELRMKADLRMGVVFPVHKSDLGELDVSLTTSIMAPPLYMDKPAPIQKFVVLPYDIKYSPRIFSVSLGLSYYFTLLNTD